MQDKSRLERVVNSWQSLADRLDDAEAAIELALEEDEPEFADEARAAAPQIQSEIEQLELRTLLGGEEDAGDADDQFEAAQKKLDAIQ